MNTNFRTLLRNALPFAAAAMTLLIGAASAARAEYSLRPSTGQTALAREVCVNVMRIGQGIVPFDACVESLAQTLVTSAPSRAKEDATSSLGSRPESVSYTQSNFEERRRKEERACARLGISPGSAGFGQCVAELDSSLRSVEHSE